MNNELILKLLLLLSILFIPPKKIRVAVASIPVIPERGYLEHPEFQS